MGVKAKVVTWLALVAVSGGMAVQTLASPEPAPRRLGPGGCRLLPHDDAFHRKVHKLPEASNSESIISQILADGGDYLHPDFGPGGNYGIPFEVVGPRQHRVPVKIRAYPSQSDPGPHPIPRKAAIEGGQRSSGDRHVLVLQRDGADRNRTCRLIELYRAFPRSGPKHGWFADSVAVFNLGRRLPHRPPYWTSADAAGLPILPGLVRLAEVRSGRINHAIRMTFTRTRQAFRSPATHHASEDCHPHRPPMGMRLRLDDDYPTAGMHPHAQVIAKALKRFGAIVADNGSNFFFTGARDARWSDDPLDDLKTIPGAAFEVVRTPGSRLTTPC